MSAPRTIVILSEKTYSGLTDWDWQQYFLNMREVPPDKTPFLPIIGLVLFLFFAAFLSMFVEDRHTAPAPANELPLILPPEETHVERIHH